MHFFLKLEKKKNNLKNKKMGCCEALCQVSIKK